MKSNLEKRLEMGSVSKYLIDVFDVDNEKVIDLARPRRAYSQFLEKYDQLNREIDRIIKFYSMVGMKVWVHQITHTDDDGAGSHVFLEGALFNWVRKYKTTMFDNIDVQTHDYSDEVTLIDKLKDMMVKCGRNERYIRNAELCEIRHIVFITDISLKSNILEEFENILESNPKVTFVFVDHHHDSKCLEEVADRYNNLIYAPNHQSVSSTMQMFLLLNEDLMCWTDYRDMEYLATMVSGYDTFFDITPETVEFNTVSHVTRNKIAELWTHVFAKHKIHSMVLQYMMDYGKTPLAAIEEGLVNIRACVSSGPLISSEQMEIIRKEVENAELIRLILDDIYTMNRVDREFLVDGKLVKFRFYVARQLDRDMSKYSSVVANMILKRLESDLSDSSHYNVVMWTDEVEKSISFRTYGNSYAIKIASELNGGGHKQAAGSSDIEQIKKFLISFPENNPIQIERSPNRLIEFGKEILANVLNGIDIEDSAIGYAVDQQSGWIKYPEPLPDGMTGDRIVIFHTTVGDAKMLFKQYPSLRHYIHNVIWSPEYGFKITDDSDLSKVAMNEWIDVIGKSIDGFSDIEKNKELIVDLLNHYSTNAQSINLNDIGDSCYIRILIKGYIYEKKFKKAILNVLPCTKLIYKEQSNDERCVDQFI